MDKKLVKRVITYYVSLSRLMESHTEHRISESGSCFCPFHDNYNTPSAKLYTNPEGESLFCFAEHKVYTSYDFISLVLLQDPTPIFNSIWNKISEKDKQYFLQFSPQYQDNYLKTELDQLKHNKISYEDFLNIIVKEVL